MNVDEIVAVVESDKGEAPVRSTHKGVLTNYLFKEGDDVKIGAEMFELDTEGKASASEAKKDEPKQEEPKKAAPEKEPTKQASEPKAEAKPEPKPAPKAPESGKAVQNDTIKFSILQIMKLKQYMKDKSLEKKCQEQGKQHPKGLKNRKIPTHR